MDPSIIETDETAEIVAIGRMISFACQRTQSMKLAFSTYCLELALTSLMQDAAQVSDPSSPNELCLEDDSPSHLH
jgi:hypothetical protein